MEHRHKYKSKAIKILEENIDKNLVTVKNSLATTLEEQPMKELILDFIKI